MRIAICDDEEKEISYTNLNGGSYTYHYKVYDEDADKVITQMNVNFQKEYNLWELPKTRKLLVYIGVAVLVLLNLIVFLFRERAIKKGYSKKLQKAREEEIISLAYTDMVTGAYNRNRFEQEKEKLNMKQVYAFFLVSVNYRDYVLNKYGHALWERILGRAVRTLKECNTEDVELYRVSDRVFAFWLKDAVNLEEYVNGLKENFAKKREDDDIACYSVMHGACHLSIGQKILEETTYGI